MPADDVFRSHSAEVNAHPLEPGYNTTIFSKPDVTVAGQGGAWTTANTGLTLFTVTGTVIYRIYGVVTTSMTSTSNTGTLAIIASGGGTALLAATMAAGGAYATGTVWVDTTGTQTSRALAGIPLTWALTTGPLFTLTIAVNSMTAGGMILYCDWIPVSAGASVV